MQFEDNTMNRVSEVRNFYADFGKANNLLSDDEGNIWFTSNNQLIKTNGARLQNILPFNEKLYAQIHSILADRKGNIWINVNNGLMKFYFDNKKQKWESKLYLLALIDNKTDITSLYEDKFGNIWVGNGQRAKGLLS